MTNIAIGTSELPGRTFGKVQTMEQSAGLQFIGLMNAFFLEHGYHLTPNEGIRSRPDQKVLRDAWETYLRYGTPFATLAAAIYNSTHDPSRGGAVDIGGPGGRVLTDAEHAWLVQHGPAYGVFWTGEGFAPQEWWHFNVYAARASISVPAGTTLLTKLPTPAPAASAYPTDWKIDMKYRLFSLPADNVNDGIKGGIWFQNLESGKRKHVDVAGEDVLIRRVLNNDGTDQMYQSQIDLVISKYIQAVA